MLGSFATSLRFAPIVCLGWLVTSPSPALALEWEARHGLTAAQYQGVFTDLVSKGYRLKVVSGYTSGWQERYAALWLKTAGPEWAARHGMSSADYQAAFNDFLRKGFRLVYVCGYAVGTQPRFAAIWEKAPGPDWVARHGLTAAQYQGVFTDLVNKGYRLRHVSGYTVNAQDFYAAIWDKSAGPAWVARHGLSAAQYQQAFNEFTGQGYRPKVVSGYQVGPEDRYAALWEKTPGPLFAAHHGTQGALYQGIVDNLVYQGYQPVYTNAFASGSAQKFNGIWEKLGPSPDDTPDVLTQRKNNERTGAYTEPGLNQSAFSGSLTKLYAIWGKLRELPVVGRVYAQPLYLHDFPMKDGRRHNVVLVATSQNWLYAFDADNFQQLWMTQLAQNDCSSFVPENKIPVPNQVTRPNDCKDVLAPDGIGIQATPVIDRGRETMYVSYRWNKGSDPRDARLRLVAINIRTGGYHSHLERDITPRDIPGFNAVWERNRASLLLLDGVIYVAFGSRDEAPGRPIFHGYILAFDADTLEPVGHFATTPPHIDGGGIWQASVGLAGDKDCSIYFATGNSRPEQPGWSDVKSLANSFVRLQARRVTAPGRPGYRVDMKVVDWFTPYRKAWLDAVDLDLGSSGVVLIPGTRYLFGGGKQGMIYLLDRDNMGKLDEAKAWDQKKVADSKPGRYQDWPEDFTADKVKQKFQAGINQYLPVPRNYVRWKPFPKKWDPQSPPAAWWSPPMNDWLPWPHIHGSPVYAEFNGGLRMIYVWPEKDHLKGFRWLGDRFDAANRVLAQGLDGRLVLAPPGPIQDGGIGMPGGFLSVAVDPTRLNGGIVFASLPRCDGIDCKDQWRGILRAFDPVTLRELWNNSGEQYGFMNFVPPTIANGKVFLATASGKVLVYGNVNRTPIPRRVPPPPPQCPRGLQPPVVQQPERPRVFQPPQKTPPVVQQPQRPPVFEPPQTPPVTQQPQTPQAPEQPQTPPVIQQRKRPRVFESPQTPPVIQQPQAPPAPQAPR